MTEFAYGIIPFYKDHNEWKVFLIHQYGSGGDTLWTFPKGRPEEGETPIETARRECDEETGLTPHIIDESFPLHTSYTFVRNGEEIEKTSAYYVGTVASPAFSTQESEVSEAGWFSIEAARTQLTFPDYRILLDQAIDVLDKLS